jgi:hypothetical protein
MAVAQVAYDELNPGAKEWADGLIATLAVDYPQPPLFP